MHDTRLPTQNSSNHGNILISLNTFSLSSFSTTTFLIVQTGSMATNQASNSTP
uniref:Uncharacterized protein n=1 Tax=Rhizophora mucronata TaxID=61149 RepID=A0A2P2PD04_RHIMU